MKNKHKCKDSDWQYVTFGFSKIEPFKYCKVCNKFERFIKTNNNNNNGK